ncbi:unnamed protein product [Cuscuta campestris]|uniref:Bidirectional sugar transporter SWEET n=1 Tax=Cuscuta campestris TaxID=132261 RepID=A0A484M6V8_9ASTE|nr:unnamed protein product [Cuscuta campestris]
MMDQDLSFYIGIIGFVPSILIFFSPVEVFWRIVRKRSTEEFESIPYMATLLCSCLWCYYGLTKPGELKVFAINAIGVLTQSFYLLIFIIFAPPKLKTISDYYAKMKKLLDDLLQDLDKFSECVCAKCVAPLAVPLTKKKDEEAHQFLWVATSPDMRLTNASNYTDTQRDEYSVTVIGVANGEAGPRAEGLDEEAADNRWMGTLVAQLALTQAIGPSVKAKLCML